MLLLLLLLLSLLLLVVLLVVLVVVWLTFCSLNRSSFRMLFAPFLGALVAWPFLAPACCLFLLLIGLDAWQRHQKGARGSVGATVLLCRGEW